MRKRRVEFLDGFLLDGLSTVTGGLERCKVESLAPRPRNATRALQLLFQTSILLVRTCTTSPFWFFVSLLSVIMPRSGRERDGVTASTSLSTLSTSSGRVARGQEISQLAPINPPAPGRLSTIMG